MTTLRGIGLAFSFLFLAFLACDNGSPTEPATAVELQTVLKATLLGSAAEPHGREVRDAATWQATWSELHGASAPPLPPVDFSREMVLVAIGPGCCGSVEISSVERGGRELVAHGLSRASTDTLCFAADFSVHVVKLSRFELPVRFAVAQEAGPCRR